MKLEEDGLLSPLPPPVYQTVSTKTAIKAFGCQGNILKLRIQKADIEASLAMLH